MMVDESGAISQTQPMETQLMRPPPPRHKDRSVQAWLVSITEPGVRYEIRKDQKEVQIGRQPDCHIVVNDKRVSGEHLRIYCDGAKRYFIEELSANGCYHNDHNMKKGDTRALKHGDEISICVHARSEKDKQIAAYIFGLADEAETAASQCAARSSGATAQIPEGICATRDSNRWKTEKEVTELWDMRTVLGSGNFSEVRLGVEVKTARRAAVKVIDKKKFLSFQSRRESHLSLSSEAEMLTKIVHTGIVQFYEWFETDMHLYLIMEYLEGGDLLQFIMDRGCFSENVARRLFRELCQAVNYLHDKSIVHRDLKPENILLTEKSEATHLKIADFGLARMNMKSADCKTFCGTPHYFAPEVINVIRDRGKEGAEGKTSGYGMQADMWSLGVILYIMLSGIPPFEEEGLYEQILEGKYEFDVREWTSVSPEAKDLVTRLMTVNPKDRLTIHGTLLHAWLLIPDPPPSPCRTTTSLDSAEPDAKRRRTEAGAEFGSDIVIGGA